MDTTDLDRAATHAFSTAVIQAHEAYARRATSGPHTRAQRPQTERVRERKRPVLHIMSDLERREKFAIVWLTRQLVEIEASFRNVRREIAKIQKRF